MVVFFLFFFNKTNINSESTYDIGQFSTNCEGQNERIPIAVNRLDCTPCLLYNPLSYYAIVLALRFGSCYSVA